MRIRFKPDGRQRAALRAQLERLQQPAPVIELLRSSLPDGYEPTGAVCTPQSVHADRFVMRVQVSAAAGVARTYALKAYSDDFGAHVWSYSRALASHHRPDRDGPCLPSRYLSPERVLVFPWVDGPFLSDIVDERKPELLRRAARLAAWLPRRPVVPEAATTVETFVAETRGRCERLRARWPETAPLIDPLLETVEEAANLLDPADAAPVHGDMAAGQFLCGDRMVLLDLDMFGYADPAYDAGHFLAQLERRCLWDDTLPASAGEWLACFRDAYLAAMPAVSPRNVSFYHGLTLVRKIYTLYRKQAPNRPDLVPQLAARAEAALEQVMSSGLPR